MDHDDRLDETGTWSTVDSALETPVAPHHPVEPLRINKRASYQHPGERASTSGMMPQVSDSQFPQQGGHAPGGYDTGLPNFSLYEANRKAHERMLQTSRNPSQYSESGGVPLAQTPSSPPSSSGGPTRHVSVMHADGYPTPPPLRHRETDRPARLRSGSQSTHTSTIISPLTQNYYQPESHRPQESEEEDLYRAPPPPNAAHLNPFPDNHQQYWPPAPQAGQAPQAQQTRQPQQTHLDPHRNQGHVPSRMTSTSTTMARRGSPPPPETPATATDERPPIIFGESRSGTPTGFSSGRNTPRVNTNAPPRRPWTPTESPESMPHGPPPIWHGTGAQDHAAVIEQAEVRRSSRGSSVTDSPRRDSHSQSGRRESHSQGRRRESRPQTVRRESLDARGSRRGSHSSQRVPEAALAEDLERLDVNDPPPSYASLNHAPARDSRSSGTTAQGYPEEKRTLVIGAAEPEMPPIAHETHPAFHNERRASQPHVGTRNGSRPASLRGSPAPAAAGPSRLPTHAPSRTTSIASSVGSHRSHRTFSPSPQQQQSPSGPPPVPEGWMAHLDQSSGQYYYIHIASSHTQWDPPQPTPAVSTPPPPPQQAPAPQQAPPQQVPQQQLPPQQIQPQQVPPQEHVQQGPASQHHLQQLAQSQSPQARPHPAHLNLNLDYANKPPIGSPAFPPTPGFPGTPGFPPRYSQANAGFPPPPESVYSQATTMVGTAAPSIMGTPGFAPAGFGSFQPPPPIPGAGIDQFRITPANGEYFGPYLRYTNMDLEHGIWLGSIMLVTEYGQAPTIHIHKTRDLSPNPRQLKGMPLYTHRSWTFYRYDVDLQMDEPDFWTYAISTPLGCTRFEFLVAGRNEKGWRFIAHSCNDFSTSVKPEEQAKLGGHGFMWKDLMQKHLDCGGFHAQIGTGNQLYADRMWKQLPSLREWSEIKGKENRKNTQWTTRAEDEVMHAYFHYYTSGWDMPHLREALAQIPYMFQLDDHDIFDGFGSYPEYMQFSHFFKNIGRIGLQWYLLFQHHTTVDRNHMQSNDVDLFTITGTGWHFVKYLGPSIAVVGLDTRSERNPHQVMTGPTYQGLFPKLASLPPSIQHAILLLAVPIVYPRMETAEHLASTVATGKKAATGAFNLLGKVASSTAGIIGAKEVVGSGFNHIKKSVGKHGLMSNVVSVFGEVDVLDDLRDHWTHESKDLERTYLIRTLQGISSSKGLRITFLSGATHTAAAGLLHDPNKPHDYKTMYQLVSSGIVNAPPPSYVIRMLHSSHRQLYVPQNGIRTSNHPSDTKEDMLEIFQNEVDGRPREHRRVMGKRNYAIFTAFEPGNQGWQGNGKGVDHGGKDGPVSMAVDFIVQGESVYSPTGKYGPVVVPRLEVGW